MLGIEIRITTNLNGYQKLNCPTLFILFGISWFTLLFQTYNNDHNPVFLSEKTFGQLSFTLLLFLAHARNNLYSDDINVAVYFTKYKCTYTKLRKMLFEWSIA